VDRLTVELSALGFQAFVTGLLGLVYFGLWFQQRRAYFATWGAAWSAFALRLGFISAYLVSRRELWLFAHQLATALTALLMLWAALQFSRGARWRARYLWLAAAALVWAALAIYVIRDMRVAGLSASILLAGVTLWTASVFWRDRRYRDRVGATVLKWTFTLWGLHHLDYPLLRPLGSGALYGVFADVLFIVAATIGTLFLVLGDGRRMLEARSHQLEQLTRLLLKAQEDERRVIARELHDEAGQLLTAVKIELDLAGSSQAGEMVGRALAQVRDLSNLLRPRALDELGLLPALRGLVEDFARRTRLDARLECALTLHDLADDVQVVVYRVVQEALTNVARHADARRVVVRLEATGDALRLAIEDDGRGVLDPPTPHLGLLGIHERVTSLGGLLTVDGAPGRGFRIEAVIPMAAS
jgi:signal transduction histidine kinase